MELEQSIPIDKMMRSVRSSLKVLKFDQKHLKKAKEHIDPKRYVCNNKYVNNGPNKIYYQASSKNSENLYPLKIIS